MSQQTSKRLVSAISFIKPWTTPGVPQRARFNDSSIGNSMTPTPSSSSTTKPRPASATKRPWTKESLRKACLQRIRQNGKTTPHELVRQELLRRIVTPCRLDYDDENENLINDDTPMDMVVDEHDEDVMVAALGRHLSEEELLSLLEELEDEMAKVEAMRIQEGLDIQQQEIDYLEGQIADFYYYHHNESSNDDEASVLCPVCRQNTIIESEGELVCPNSMDHESCTFRIPKTDTIIISLSVLREQLRKCLDGHSSHCEGDLNVSCNENGRLEAFCPLCCEQSCVILSPS